MDSLDGRLLGHYRVIRAIGAGGMGQVYLAEDERLARKVALKVISSSFLDDATSKERLLNEARVAASIDHPSICTVYEVAEDDGVTFIAMKYVEGEALSACLRQRPFSEAEVARIATQVAEALAEAHAAGIVHRDIKPQNVMLTPRGRAVVLDFGLARLTENAGARLTRTGQIVGTPAFMSPEQISGEQLDGRSDIFSLGVLIYELLTGRSLFERPTIHATIAAVLFEAVSLDDLPSRWKPILKYMLARSPEQRYADMAALLRDLNSFDSPPPIVAATDEPTAKFDRPSLTQPKPAEEERTGVAVLPFRWIGEEGRDDVLAEGLTESAIDALSRIARLRVLARSTVFRLGQVDDYSELARRFGVGKVLVGDLKERAGSVIVNLELVDTNSGSRTWGSRLEKKHEEVAALHAGIGSVVVEPFGGINTRAGESTGGARNPEAFRLYLVGRQQWNRRIGAATKEAVESFQQAINLDPSFAAAYAGLGDSLAYLGFLQMLSPRSVFPRARASAERALSLNPKLGEAVTTLAYVRMNFDFDFHGASALFREALSLNPNYAQARNWFGIALANHGDFDQADEELARAADLDPLSTITSVSTAFTHYYRRDFDRTLRIYRELLDIDPNFGPLLNYYGNALAVVGRPEEGLEYLSRLLAMGESGLALAGTGFAHAKAGDEVSARKTLARMDEIGTQTYMTPFAPAVVHAGLGDVDDALKLLDRCLEDRMPWLPTVKFDPRFDALRGDPRFDDFLGRVGFWG